MPLGQLHTNGRFVRGGECSCGFSVESSRELDVEAVDSLLSALGASSSSAQPPTFVQH
jgi:hypothetical protein